MFNYKNHQFTLNNYTVGYYEYQRVYVTINNVRFFQHLKVGMSKYQGADAILNKLKYNTDIDKGIPTVADVKRNAETIDKQHNYIEQLEQELEKYDSKLVNKLRDKYTIDDNQTTDKQSQSSDEINDSVSDSEDNYSDEWDAILN